MRGRATARQPRLNYRLVDTVVEAGFMLLYLNNATFGDGGATAQLVSEAMDSGATVVLVQELDPTRGACAFRRFFEVTPVDLLKQRRLFDTLAVPLYPSAAHRNVSFLYIERAMGAVCGRLWRGHMWSQWRVAMRSSDKISNTPPELATTKSTGHTLLLIMSARLAAF